MSLENIKILRQETGAGVLDCRQALHTANDDLKIAMSILIEKGFHLAQKKETRVAADGIAFAGVYGQRAVLLEISSESDFVAGNALFIANAEQIARAIAKYNPTDLEQLLQCPSDDPDLTVRQLTQKMVLMFNEKIVIRRFQILNGDFPIAFMHQNGKYGVILNLSVDRPIEASALQLIGKEIAMQIAAMQPKYLTREQIQPAALAAVKAQLQTELELEQAMHKKPPAVLAKILQGRLEKFYRESCLLEQQTIKDDSITVAQYLAAAGSSLHSRIQVTEFYRYQKAEELGS